VARSRLVEVEGFDVFLSKLSASRKLRRADARADDPLINELNRFGGQAGGDRPCGFDAEAGIPAIFNSNGNSRSERPSKTTAARGFASGRGDSRPSHDLTVGA